MRTPFDKLVEEIEKRGFHNQRLQDHSTTVSKGILRDLRLVCEPFRRDFDNGVIRAWLDYPSPAGRGRDIDLLLGEPRAGTDGPDLARVRVCVENKSVFTAHRNRTNRYDDREEFRNAIHGIKPEAVLVATILVGVAPRVLNVADRVKPFMNAAAFEELLPRLSSGDQRLWDEFPPGVSTNDAKDPLRTVEKFRQLPTRPPGHTHVSGYDFVLLVPMLVDNVNPPSVARENKLGIDVDADYRAMIDRICRAYTARWHL